ncbi:MAG: hypothetical protein ACE15C_21465 [Phycisphaerae bacterium]
MFRRPIWSSASRLQIGGRQLASTEYLLGGLLALIIVGALVMVIYQQFKIASAILNGSRAT